MDKNEASPSSKTGMHTDNFIHHDEMESKRAAAVTLCCILILISGEMQQVAAMSKFCRCYKQCYPDCRLDLPRFTCIQECINKCIPFKKVAASDCNRNCLFKICGTALEGQDDAASCVDDCTKNTSLNTKYP
uniref:Uncharacterized protein n=1 Tax=Leersia perrieri TaxID=77586 RepID=A0A0D9VBE4_9ORYZ